MNTMTKAQLIAAIAEKAALPKADTNRALAALVDVIQDQAAKGVTVRIGGFGHFKARVRPARTGRNPRTGEEVTVPERTVLGFKPSKGKPDA